MKKIIFLEKEKEKICELFETEANLKEIAKNFGCSGKPIGRVLIEILGLEKYKKIAKEHLFETRQKNGRRMGLKYGLINLKKWQEEHPEQLKELGRKLNIHPNTIAVRPENGRKAGLKYGPITIKKAIEWCAKNHTWISSWEDKFYELLISQNPHLTVKRQYYLKGLTHPYDFAIPELNLLIEIDGDRWHGHSGNKEMDSKSIKRDKEVDKFAKDNGWKVIRINNNILKKLGIIK